jgi:hypothetical protein
MPRCRRDAFAKCLGIAAGLAASHGKPMIDQLSVSDLQEYWKRVDAMVEGDSIGIISIRRMPPWDDLCEGLGWHYHRVDGGYFTAKHHGFCGVYRLIALAEAGDVRKPAVLTRVCGQDNTGTLYIGEAGNLSLRLNQLRRSARKHRGEGSHGAITMLRQITRLDYPPDKLAIALMFTGRSTRGVERDLINA